VLMHCPRSADDGRHDDPGLVRGSHRRHDA
jgi:hypothetical protein